MSFKPYPKYKESGIEWLGRVPEHWEVRRLRQIGPLLKGSGGTKEDVVETGVPCVRYGDLYTTHAYFVRQSRTCVTDERSTDYFPIQRGDVLFAASGEDLAEIGRSAVNLIEGDAVCGGDLVVLRPQISAVPEFLGYACDSWVAKAQKAAMGRGTTVKHIYPDELKRLIIALPSPEEQTRIANFLDHETAKIDALIAEQQRLIELLQEKRQAVISHAVTKGLNPDAPMKDSGIEWLGKVPEHWEPRRLRGLYRQLKRQDQSNKQVLSVYRDYGVVPKDSRDDNMNKTPEDLSAYQLVEPGDLVVNKMKAWQGSLGISAHEGITSPDYVVFAPTHQEDLIYLHYVLRGRNMADVYRAISNGIRPSQWRLEPDRFLGLTIYLPPAEEQRAIALMIGAIARSYDPMEEECARSIALLQERRSALISAAVTGQIDVREFAGGSEAA